MQILEGEETAVDETYGRILKDPLHTDLMLLECAPIKTRSFGRWSMAFKRLTPMDIEAHPAYVPLFTLDKDAAAIGANKEFAFDMLTDFARSQGG
jgi:hypothetical protein